MDTIIIALLDVKLGRFNNPIFFPNRAVAARAIKDAVNAPDSEFSKHPEDYQFFVVGEFDSSNAFLAPISPPELFFSAKDFVS